MKKLFVLMAHIPKASCSLYRRCCKIAVTKIKKKKKKKEINYLEVHDSQNVLDPYVPPVSCKLVGCPKVGYSRFLCFCFGVFQWCQQGFRVNSINNNC